MTRLMRGTRFTLGAAALFALTASACATMNISSHVRPDVDIATYKTFDWGPADGLPTGDPRLDQDPFFQDHVQGAIEKEMGTRGFVRAADGENADLLLHYHAVIQQRLDVNQLDREWGYCYDDGCTARVVEYEEGTLVLDVVDRATNRVIWRGWAQKAVQPMLASRDEMSKQLQQAVKGMFARFPRPL
jgi:hypothetical protein